MGKVQAKSQQQSDAPECAEHPRHAKETPSNNRAGLPWEKEQNLRREFGSLQLDVFAQETSTRIAPTRESKTIVRFRSYADYALLSA